MAEVLSAWPNKRPHRRGSRFDPFLDGQIWRVEATDLGRGATAVNPVRVGFHSRARALGFDTVRVSVERKDPLTLLVQAIGTPRNGKAEP